jgi:hypothetical protein
MTKLPRLKAVQIIKVLKRGALNPNFAKVGGLQSQDVKGEAVIYYRNPLTTQDLKFSGFPAG